MNFYENNFWGGGGVCINNNKNNVVIIGVCLLVFIEGGCVEMQIVLRHSSK